MQANVAGTWRKVLPKANVAGTWRDVYIGYANVYGTWRPLMSYSWSVGGFGSCSVSCGGGTQYRSVSCYRNDGTSMPDVFCSMTASKPSTSQSCNTHPCYSYSWVARGDWGTCSKTCGGGVQTQTISCKQTNTANASDWSYVSNTYCASVASKPSNSRTCNTQSCTTYSWNTSNWSSCSVSCGSGTQTRSVTCKGSDGSTQADSVCINSGAGAKPTTSQGCYAGACPSYSWLYGSWGSCGASCGTGNISRTATCKNNGVTVLDRFCVSALGNAVSTQSCGPVCTGCVFQDTSYLNNKVYQTNVCGTPYPPWGNSWTYDRLVAHLAATGFTTYQHYIRFGSTPAERVCPHNGYSCCKQSNLIYISCGYC